MADMISAQQAFLPNRIPFVIPGYPAPPDI